MSRLCFLSVLAAGLAASANAATLQGKVTDKMGAPIDKAIVKLTPLGISDTTGTDGRYSISTGPVSISRNMSSTNRNVSYRNGIIELNLHTEAPVTVEIFDTKGGVIHSEELKSVSRGVYQMDISGHARGNQVLLIKVTAEGSVATYRYASFSKGSAASFSEVGNSSSLARVAAAPDSIVVSAVGFKPRTVAAPSLDATLNVTLDPVSSDRWGGLGNAPIKSVGCGKTSAALPRSGTYNIPTVSGRGTFIIDIPSNYNKDNPYRLIFGNHCMGGSAARVAEAEKGTAGDDLSGFYSIKTMATKENVQNIYVALQGNGDGTWNGPSDYTFWSDVLKHVETNLCVDTTRRFVAGFSFGAMFSYALSLQYPERIRAVATYAPANWNFHQPTNRKIPIAYYQAHGTNDGLCKWVNNDGMKQGGKYCLMQHVQDNGCTGEPKITTGSTHVTTEFTGCKEGYPVKFSSFQGGHQAVHSDPGTNFSWIEKETWQFFKQF